MSVEPLQAKLRELEQRLQQQVTQQAHEQQKVDGEIRALTQKITEFEAQNQRLEGLISSGGADPFVRRVEWTIDDFDKKLFQTQRGESMWSPEFKAMGVPGMQLEFFPKGREATTVEGFCSLFLWCPSNTKIKYQLWVGNHLRAPDEDEYDGRMGHGHSNFCMIEAEMFEKNGSKSVTVGVDIIDVSRSLDKEGGLTLISRSPEAMVAKEAEVIQNQSVSKVEWRIDKISERMKALPRGAQMYSKVFTAGGVREILLEFYPCGSQNTTKDGYCAFYIRCPEGTSIIVTLFVGTFQKGPIQTTFDSFSGKGLPEFCLIDEQIDKETDSITVGISLKHTPTTTLQI